MDSCVVCGATRFEEIDGLFYCVVCQAQQMGATLERRDDVFVGTGLTEVRKGKEKKTMDTGVAWTTTEAFNCILMNMSRDLTEKLQLPSDFRRILLGLWATYLAESEIAFVEGNEVPKVHLTSTRRDIQLLHQGLEKVARPKYREYTPRPLAATADLSINRSFYWVKIKQKENLDTSAELPNSMEETVEGSVEGSVGQSVDRLSLCTIPEFPGTDILEKNTLIEVHKTEDTEMADIDSIGDGSSDAENYEPEMRLQESDHMAVDLYNKELIGPPVKKLRSSLRLHFQKVRRALINIEELSENITHDSPRASSDSICPEENLEDVDQRHLQFSSFSNRSQVIKNLTKKEDLKPLLKHVSDISVDKMTMSKALALIILTFRIMNLDYYVCDILQWIKLGHISFFDPIKYLPSEWVILPGEDSIRLHPRELPCAKNLSLNVVLIKNFLGIDSLPHPNLRTLIRRFLVDLNLPLSLESYIVMTGFLSNGSYTSKLFPSENLKTLPSYEAHAFSILIVALRKFFLTGVSLKISATNQIKPVKTNSVFMEKLLSNHVADNFDNAFIWSDWLEHTMVCWKLIKRYFLPINRELESNINDCDIMLDYYKSVSKSWLGIDNVLARRKDYASSKEFHETLSQLMEDLTSFRKGSTPLSDQPVTTYHFQGAKVFVERRLNNMGFDTSIMLQEFGEKSTEFLKKFKINTDNLTPLKYHAKWDSCAEQWPMSINLLIEIGSFILCRPTSELAAKIYRLDAIMFNQKSSKKLR